MALNLQDNRVIIDEADNTTGWTGGSPTAVTSTFAESTASIGDTLNIATGQLFFTTAATDISDSLVYIRSQNQALQEGWITGAHAMFFTDGTNDIAFHRAGADRTQFIHADNEVFFQSFIFDGKVGKDRPGRSGFYITEVAGTLDALDLTAIVDWGSHFITQSKALGGGQNVFVDIIRHDVTGHDGVTITGGTPGDEADFTQLAEADRSTANQAGHGIFRQYTTGIFGCQGTLKFGNFGSDTFFLDVGSVVAYEDRDLADDRYWFYVQGSSQASDSINFYLNGVTITTARPAVTCFFSDDGIDHVDLRSCSFRNLRRTVEFADDANSAGHFVTDCVFDNVGMIDPGTVNFQDNTISNPADKLGGLLIDADGTDRISNITFISDGSGHAFYIHSPGTYTLTNWSYVGFGADETEDASGFNDSNGAVTLNISGGDSPTIRNGAGATTTLVNTVTLTITVLDEAGLPIQGARVAIYSDPEGPSETELMNELTNASGVATENFNFEGDVSVSVRVRKSSTGATKYFAVNSPQTITSAGLDITITMIEDDIAISNVDC